MIKKGTALVLALLLLFAPTTVLAQGETVLIYDTADLLTAEEEEAVFLSLQEAGAKHACLLVVVTASGLEGEEVSPYLDSFCEEHPFEDDGVLFFLSDRYWAMRTTYGRMDHLISDEDSDAIWETMKDAANNGENAAALQIFAASCDAVLTEEEARNSVLVDDADLLDDSAEANLLARLAILEKELACKVVIVTKDNIDGHAPMEYADDYFDYHDYGTDGVLLLVTMQERKWHISTAGWCIEGVNDAALSYLEDKMVSHLTDKEYEEAFDAFCTALEKVLKPYHETGREFKAPLSAIWIVISLAVGAVAALITVHGMVQKLKTVRFQPAATSYVRNGSFQLRESNEVYLYSNVSKTRRESSSSSSGGGSHTSSSGSSHGGGGGSF